jgi:hypothetical protein
VPEQHAAQSPHTIAPPPPNGRSVPVAQKTQVTPEAALLTRLRIPVTAATLAAARNVSTATQRLTGAYARLDTMLAEFSPDARIPTLRTLLSFIGKIDLPSAAALPERVAAFVSNAVAGPESKLAQIVRAENVQGTIVERTLALERDVKTLLLSLAQDPPANAPPQVLQAVRDALSATASVQLNALRAQNGDESAIAIALPAYFYEGGKPAHLRVTRDGSGRRSGFDAENFHIAFVLDTESLGTVAIELHTAGRDVNVSVRTERAKAADRFRTTFGDLRARLESLRYRVRSMAAGVETPRSVTPRPFEPLAEERKTSNLDMRA